MFYGFSNRYKLKLVCYFESLDEKVKDVVNSKLTKAYHVMWSMNGTYLVTSHRDSWFGYFSGTSWDIRYYMALYGTIRL